MKHELFQRNVRSKTYLILIILFISFGRENTNNEPFSGEKHLENERWMEREKMWTGDVLVQQN